MRHRTRTRAARRTFSCGTGSLIVSVVLLGVIDGFATVHAQPAAPPKTETSNAVDAIIDRYQRGDQDGAKQDIDSLLPGIVSAAVAEKLAPPSAPIARDELLVVHQIELERTDKQLGSSSKSSASTSATEKPGIPWLLALGVETGAITQAENESGVTLSTSPYSFVTLGMKDTPDVYAKYDYLWRLGLAASFALDSGGAPEDRNFDPSALTEFSAKYVLFGDRSSRSRWFHERWLAEVQGFVISRLNADTAFIHAVRSCEEEIQNCDSEVAKRDRAELKAVFDRARQTIPPKVIGLLQQPGVEREKLQVDLSAAIQSGLDEAIVDLDATTISEAKRARITEMARGVIGTRKHLKEEEKAIQSIIERAQHRPEVSAAYTLHRKKDDADYSEAKILAEFDTSFINFVGNASISFNHSHSPIPTTEESSDEEPPTPTEGKKRDTVRDYSISLSLEKKIPNFLPIHFGAAGTDEIALSLNGKLLRLEDENDELGVVQARASFPLATGVDLPISVTYATRSEYVDEDEIRGNFGVSVDTDKLWSLAKLSLSQ